jgi:hypothetical protein
LNARTTSLKTWGQENQHASPAGKVRANRDSQSAEETTDPVIADHHNFYKVEKWTKDKVDHMLYAGGKLDKPREVFAAAIKHRPRIRLTIRQRSHVLEQWPAGR